MSIVLVLNAGSSSLKISIARIDEANSNVCHIEYSDNLSFSFERTGDEVLQSAIEKALSQIDTKNIDAVGHRVVHGGRKLTSSHWITNDVEDEIEALCEIAPLHNPPALRVLRAAKKLLPGPRHYAVFDTAFHSTIPMESRVYPLPYEWFEKLGIMRFGFHGISHSYCSARAAQLLGTPISDLRMVTCHLGNGCSLAAVRGGISCDTTMGFTPLEGLMMGSRCGSIDPGIIIHMLRSGTNVEELDKVLNSQSGLAGVSGIGKDMQEIQRSMKQGNERALLAFEMFVHRVCGGIASMSASIRGAQALIFTGGIGENSAQIRSAVCDRLQWLGAEIDHAKNLDTSGDAIISIPSSRVSVLVVSAREDLAIAQERLKLA